MILTVGPISNAFPKTLSASIAINILNDVSILQGVLIGFVSLLVVQNIEAMDKEREESGIHPLQNLRRFFTMIFDIVITTLALFSIVRVVSI